MGSTSKLVSRLVGESSETYRTSVTKLDASGIGSGALVESGNATVTWDLSIEGRSWGVKDLDVVLQSVEAVLHLEHESGTRPDFVASWSTSKPNGWKTQVRFEGLQLPGNLYPKEVVVHVVEQRIEVVF
jgi:hypothetical protein